MLDVATGERRQLTPKEGKGGIVDARFGADGKSVLVVTDRRDLGSSPGGPRAEAGQARVRVAHPEREVGRGGLRRVGGRPDGGGPLFNEDGVSWLRRIDVASGRTTDVALPPGVVGAVHMAGGSAGAGRGGAVGTATAPSDGTGAAAGAKPVRWTASEMGGLNEASLVTPELVRYPSTDGVQVLAFLYKARGAKGKAPVMMLFHGGPEGQSRPIAAR